MPRLLKIAAFLLAALWLPTTVHCQLETIGLGALLACADQTGEASHDDASGCTDDGCQTVESGQIVVAKGRLDVALLPAIACAGHFCLFELRAPAPAAELIAVRQDETLPLQRTWQFDRRAALPARAPGLNG
jgi:hypothetical protein